MFRALVCLLVAAIPIAALTGCGGGNPSPCRVSGSLTYKGQPIKTANMAFHTADGGVRIPAAVDADGYVATDLPPGEFIITVETESFKAAAAAGKSTEKYASKYIQNQQQRPPPEGHTVAPAASPKETYVKIPEKYSNTKNSPLTATLKPGRQVVNFELAD
jgi:hypothetical protein